MEQDDLKVQDKVCLCAFTTKELTCLLMAVANTYGRMMSDEFDSEAWGLMPKHSQNAMMEMMGDLRPKVTQIIFEAIGNDNAEACMAFVEQQIAKRNGQQPN